MELVFLTTKKRDAGFATVSSATTVGIRKVIVDTKTLKEQLETPGNSLEKSLDFQGRWRTKVGFKAQVVTFKYGLWFGWLIIDNLAIPTFWSPEGASTSDRFTLMERIREAII